MNLPAKFNFSELYTAPKAVDGFLAGNPVSFPVLQALPNLLFHGDNLTALEHLQSPQFAEHIQALGGLKLVYIDPPFAVGSDFFMPVGKTLQTAYTDTWASKKDFLEMLRARLLRIHELLAPDGAIFVHCDWRTSAHMRLLLDEIFGEEQFLGEIIWHYTGGGRSTRYFSRKHDSIFHYAKGKKWTFNIDAVRVPYKSTSNYAKGGIVAKSGKLYLPNPLGTPLDDVWDIPMVNPLAKERVGYPTQKPESLLERIILVASNAGDLVGDFFCGSGTTLAVAQKLGRRWIGSDLGDLAVQTTRQRILALQESHTHCAKNKGETKKLCGKSASTSFMILREQEPNFTLDLLSLACSWSDKKLGEIQPVQHTTSTSHKLLHIQLTKFQPVLPKQDSFKSQLFLQGETLWSKDKAGQREKLLEGWQNFIASWSLGFFAGGSGEKAGEGVFVSLWNSPKALEHNASICMSTALFKKEIFVQLTDIFGQIFWKKLQ